MTEPASTSIGAALGWKAMGGAAGVAAGGLTLGTIVVMLMTKPRTEREWAVAIISSIVASISGGSAFILHYHLTEWFQSYTGLMAIGGIYFAASLPGWTLVRWLFNYLIAHQDKDLMQVINEGKAAVLPVVNEVEVK